MGGSQHLTYFVFLTILIKTLGACFGMYRNYGFNPETSATSPPPRQCEQKLTCAISSWQDRHNFRLFQYRRKFEWVCLRRHSGAAPSNSQQCHCRCDPLAVIVRSLFVSLLGVLVVMVLVAVVVVVFVVVVGGVVVVCVVVAVIAHRHRCPRHSRHCCHRSCVVVAVASADSIAVAVVGHRVRAVLVVVVLLVVRWHWYWHWQS